jgi:hypothetical protein
MLGRYVVSQVHARKEYEMTGQVRSTDPDTSKAAAKVRREPLRERLYNLIKGMPGGVVGTGAAKVLEAPLNSITPRFAELRKANRIWDSGERINGQTVWKALPTAPHGSKYIPILSDGKCTGCVFHDSGRCTTLDYRCVSPHVIWKEKLD